MILFSAAWCNPCKSLKQWIDANNIEGIDVVDVDKDKEQVTKFGIRSVPTLVADGNVYSGNAIKLYLETLIGAK